MLLFLYSEYYGMKHSFLINLKCRVSILYLSLRSKINMTVGIPTHTNLSYQSVLSLQERLINDEMSH